MAERALSIKTLMPFLKNKLSVLGCKLLRLRQLAHLEVPETRATPPQALPRNSFTLAISYVSMNGPMLVAIGEEPLAVLLENLRHAGKLPNPRKLHDYFCRTTRLPTQRQ